MQVLKRILWEPYKRALEQRPLLTKMCTASVLMGVGDAVSQTIESIFTQFPFVVLSSVSPSFVTRGCGILRAYCEWRSEGGGRGTKKRGWGFAKSKGHKII